LNLVAFTLCLEETRVAGPLWELGAQHDQQRSGPYGTDEPPHMAVF